MSVIEISKPSKELLKIITLEQYEEERKIEEILYKCCRDGLISEKEANKKIEARLSYCYRNNVFLKKDKSSYRYRRDKENTRSHTVFFKNTILRQEDEHRFFMGFFNVKQKTIKNLTWESFGCDVDKGLVIAEFKQRMGARPDYKLFRDGNFLCYIEVKIPKTSKHRFKIKNLITYNTNYQNTSMLVCPPNSCFLYSSRCVTFILDKLDVNNKHTVHHAAGGKEWVEIGPYDCDFTIEQLQATGENFIITLDRAKIEKAYNNGN